MPEYDTMKKPYQGSFHCGKGLAMLEKRQNHKAGIPRTGEDSGKTWFITMQVSDYAKRRNGYQALAICDGPLRCGGHAECLHPRQFWLGSWADSKSLHSAPWQLEKSGLICSWYCTNHYTICPWNRVELHRFVWAAGKNKNVWKPGIVTVWRLIKGYKWDDKNTFRVPRQDLPDVKKRL